MNKKEILHKCEMIYSVFDDLENARVDCNLRDSGEIRSLIYGLVNEEKRIKSSLGEAYSNEIDEALTPLILDFCTVSFAFGYAIGNLFDSRYPKVENAVKSIQSLLKEKALLPYFPREKKGGQHEKEGGKGFWTGPVRF